MPDPVEPSFGELLVEYRSAAGLTQEGLAARARLSTDAVGLLERGARTSPRSTTVRLLAEALRLSPREHHAFAGAARRQRRPAAGLRAPPDLRLPSTPFVGRDRELARVGALLARPDVRLLTLTGSPGAGKTRLALEAGAALADRYRDGAVVVTLGPLTGAGLVMPAIRDALGLSEVAGQPPLETVAAHCRVRHLLLVLDNFEHLLTAGPELLELLARCPGLEVLATSRAPLRLRAEHELPVPPLQVPTDDQVLAGEPAALREVPSVRLFLDRVEAAVPGFQVTARNAAAVAAICRRLDGLPLALELAAPWMKLLSPAELLSRLDSRLELLTAGPRDMPERQRTMRAALGWSCELLEPEARALLRRLAVFAGGAPLGALERVCEAAGALPGGALKHLAALVDNGLVQSLPDELDELDEPRVTMLESIREYARELLAASGELEATARGHLERHVDLAARARREILGPAQEWWLRQLRLEHDNLRAALGWAVEHGQPEAGLRLAAALSVFWDYAGHRREGLSWLERLLAAGGSVAPQVRAEALRVAASLAWHVGANETSIARQRESLALFRELGDPRGVASAMRGLAIALDAQGSYAESLRLFEESVSLLREMGDREVLALALLSLGVRLARHGDGRGDRRRATALYEEALAIYRDMGSALSTAHCLVNLGNRAKADGSVELAQARYEEAAAIACRLDSSFLRAAALAGLGDVARIRGDVAAAGAHWREGLRLFAGSDERQGIAVCLLLLGWVAWKEGRAVAAARLCGAGEALWPQASTADEDEERLHTETAAALRERLGDERFAAAHAAGGRLSLEEAVAEALERSPSLGALSG